MDGWVGAGIRKAPVYSAYVWTVRRFQQQQKEENEFEGGSEGGSAREKGMHKIQMLFVIFINGAVTWTAI